MTFKLKLNNRKLSPKELAEQYAKQALQTQKKQTKLITDWLEQESDFDTQNLIKLWESLRKEYGFKFANEAIKFMAISNSIVDVNNFMVRKMKMEGVAISQEEFNNLLGKLFTVNVSNTVIAESGLPQKVQDDIMGRIVARNFPNRDAKSKEFMVALPTEQ